MQRGRARTATLRNVSAKACRPCYGDMLQSLQLPFYLVAVLASCPCLVVLDPLTHSRAQQSSDSKLGPALGRMKGS